MWQQTTYGFSEKAAHAECIIDIQPCIRRVVITNDKDFTRLNDMHSSWFSAYACSFLISNDCIDEGFIKQLLTVFD